MAQNYTEQLRKDNVRDAIYEDLQNNCEVLRTSWSGNAFPANPKVGQPCYRVDEDKLYYWDGYKWSQKGGGGSAELKTMELAAATSERVSITLEGARCLDKNMMFVFVDKIAQDPSTYSMNDDGTVVNFNPSIPANAAVTLRWFDTDVGTFDTAIFASDAEFAAGELTNKAPNVKQVHSLSDQIQTSNANYVKSELQSNLLNYTTNRILEIPQDIKLELNNGTLTLKAGSKVYVPNGAGVFDEVTVHSDVAANTFNNSKQMHFYNVNGHYFERCDMDSVFSGSTAPSNVPNYSMWYDTSTNKLKRYINGSWNEDSRSLPICIATSTTTEYTSIDQVFNGFGYIGSTVFALPGVKGAIPNGRNEDGTCKAILTTLTSVKTVTFTNAAQRAWYLQTKIGASSGNLPVYSDTQPSQNYIRWFSQKNNQWYDTHGSPELNGKTHILPLAVFNTDSTGKITSFEPYTVDSVVNSNEFYQLRDKAVTTDTTQTISGVKTFNSETLQVLRPILLKENNADEGGQIYFERSDNSVLKANPYIDLYQNSIRFIGTNSNNTINIPLQVDLQNKQVLVPTPALTANNDQAATTAWVRNFLTPTGAIIIWSTSTPPEGYLICDGAAISRTTYAHLFNVIGTTWGVGDGNTTFNLPNFVGGFIPTSKQQNVTISSTGQPLTYIGTNNVTTTFHNRVDGDPAFGGVVIGTNANSGAYKYLSGLTATSSISGTPNITFCIRY